MNHLKKLVSFCMAQIPWLILHKQLVLIKFGRHCDIRKMMSIIQGNHQKKGIRARSPGDKVTLFSYTVQCSVG